jgi:hypothetical protein
VNVEGKGEEAKGAIGECDPFTERVVSNSAPLA